LLASLPKVLVSEDEDIPEGKQGSSKIVELIEFLSVGPEVDYREGNH
jgi:hypothetical protein